jgi:hypothetical protein
VLLKDAGIALRGLFLINPEVPPPGRGLAVAGGRAACMSPARASPLPHPPSSLARARLQGVIEHITINNPSVGRSVDEAKRLLQAVQFVAEHGEARTCCFHDGSLLSALPLSTSCAHHQVKLLVWPSQLTDRVSGVHTRVICVLHVSFA